MSSAEPDFAARLQAGERRALAEAISRIEAGDESVLSLVPAMDSAPRPRIIGVTGAGGSGKSTLIAALVPHLRSLGLKVAVIASDPSSPISGGALLGDRVRVEPRPTDEGFYFRSLSTRGASGGLSRAVPGIISLLSRSGFDVILVETVGVGQDQYEVRQYTDRLLLILNPYGGDEIQLQKAGLIELVDVIAVNKADLPGADILIALLREFLGETPVIPVVATLGEGIERLWREGLALPAAAN